MMDPIELGTTELTAEKKAAFAFDPLVPTVFHEHWWLTAATGGCYEQVEVSDGSHVIGRFPYAVTSSRWRTTSTQPVLTHLLGPAVDEGCGSGNTRFLQRYNVTRELIAKLPPMHRFWQNLHRGYPEVLSFQSCGFRTGVQFTFEIQPQSLPDAWNKLRNKTRNVIRRAEEQLEVSELFDPELFLSFYETNLATRGKLSLDPRDKFSAVCAAALEKSSAKILCAKDKNRKIVAAIFLVFDKRAGYYLMSTRALEAANGAVSLLIWNGIRTCMERRIVFDFDGIANEGVILLYAGFGGESKPLYIVAKESTAAKFVDSCRGIIGRSVEKNFFDEH